VLDYPAIPTLQRFFPALRFANEYASGGYARGQRVDADVQVEDHPGRNLSLSTASRRLVASGAGQIRQSRRRTDLADTIRFGFALDRRRIEHSRGAVFQGSQFEHQAVPSRPT